MGNSQMKKRDSEFSGNVDSPRITSTLNRSLSPHSDSPRSKQFSSTSSGKLSTKDKYAFIPDNFTTLQQVTSALRKEGLESSNLILGIDFTKSNEWTGRNSFNNRSLHAIGDTPNPYEKAISIIGKTLAPFDDDNLIPCFGFGDATTHDHEVFNFHADNTSCHGFEEVLACYQKVVPNLSLSGPTSYAPVIEAAIDIVEKTHGQFHVLVIVADGQVTTNGNNDGKLSPQEEKTIKAIADASSYPLSIVLVGVGDGPWEDMKKFVSLRLLHTEKESMMICALNMGKLIYKNSKNKWHMIKADPRFGAWHMINSSATDLRNKDKADEDAFAKPPNANMQHQHQQTGPNPLKNPKPDISLQDMLMSLDTIIQIVRTSFDKISSSSIDCVEDDDFVTKEEDDDSVFELEDKLKDVAFINREVMLIDIVSGDLFKIYHKLLIIRKDILTNPAQDTVKELGTICGMASYLKFKIFILRPLCSASSSDANQEAVTQQDLAPKGKGPASDIGPSNKPKRIIKKPKRYDD